MKQLFVVLVIQFFLLSIDSQAQSLYIWKPVGASTSVKIPGNWKINTCNGSVATGLPGSSDTLVFSNCSGSDAVIDTNLNVNYIQLKSNYTGTVTQCGSYTITTGKMKVSAGTFTGGGGSITINGTLAVDGGTFTSTSGLMTVRGNFSKTGSTFNHNNGTVKFQNETTGQLSISSTSKTSAVDFYDVVLDASDTSATFRVNNMLLTVNHSLLMSGDEQLFINGDTILMSGSSALTLTNTSNTGGGTAKIKFSGSSTQSITGNTGTDYTKLPNLVINKSGTLNMSGNIGLGGSAYLHYYAGTIVEGTSSFLFYYNDTIKGAMTFYDVEFAGHSSNFYLTDTININHDLNLSGTAYTQVNNGGIKLYNNLSYTNSHSSSVLNTSIQFSNVSAGQSVLGTHSVTMDKLIMKNAGQTLILQKPTIVKYYLVLNAGFIKSDATNLLTLAASCAVIGGSSSSFVKGPIKKVGNTSFSFPLGGETSFKPCSITAPSSTSDAFTAEYFPVIQKHAFAKDSLTYLSSCEYWNLNRTSGSSNVKVTLSWDASSCDIYTLSTLKIGRWDGSKWNNTGPTTTTGNPTAGTLQTNSNQSAFGDFIIAKRSPSISANAGVDVSITLGNSVTLGGSPTASGGIAPYTYKWSSSYALNSSTTSNPTAIPVATRQYILKVTDLDHSVAKDTILVTVNGFDLKSAKRFPILAEGNITVSAPVNILGAAGTKGSLTGTIIATDSVLINTSSVALAVRHLDTAITKIDALSASTIDASLGGETYTSGVYRITSSANLNGTLVLEGDANSFFIFDINGSLNIASGAEIELSGVRRDQIYFNVSSNITITTTAALSGHFQGRGNFTGTVVSGDLAVQVMGYINGAFPPMMTVIHATGDESTLRPIKNFFGYNASIVINNEGLGSDNGDNDLISKTPQMTPWLLRYPGGSDANWWRWQSGWFRGYDNPLYNDQIAPGSNPPTKYKDNLPFPPTVVDGIPYDLNISAPRLNSLNDLKAVCDASASIPLFDLNMATSDLGSQIAMLFKAHCMGIPVKYIELGNEPFTKGDIWSDLEFGNDYAAKADMWAAEIKQYFNDPELKIAIVGAITKGDDVRRNKWNSDIIEYINSVNGVVNFDALTFHIYPNFNIDKSVISDECGYTAQQSYVDQIMARPFEVYDELEHENDMDFCGAALGQKELSMYDWNDDDVPDFEIWLTEINTLEENYKADGTWIHTLFVASQCLRALDDTYTNITRVMPYCLYAGPSNGVWFDDKTTYTAGTACSSPLTTEWEMGPTGFATKYLAEATRNTNFAKKIDFGAIDKIVSPLDCDFDDVYGWFFSNVENFAPENKIYAIILNLSEASHTLDLPDDLFPPGVEEEGEYEQIQLSSYAELDDLKTLITGDGEVVISEPKCFGCSTTTDIPLPAYSLTLVRNPAVLDQTQYPQPINIQVSNSTTCTGGEVTFYLNGADKYYVASPSVEVALITGKTMKVYPTVTTTYTIAGTDGETAWNSEEVTITVSDVTDFSLSSDVGELVCSGTEVNLTADPSSDPYLGPFYNWYPADGNILSSHEGSEVIATPIYVGENPFVFIVNATDKVCYCGEQSIEIELVEPVSAGPDLWVCNEEEGEFHIGVEEQSGTISWTGPTDFILLSSFTDPYPYFTEFPPVTETFTYIVSADVSGCESSDEVEVHVLECCEGLSGALVFDPFHDPDGAPYEDGNSNLTAYSFIRYMNTQEVSPEDYANHIDVFNDDMDDFELNEIGVLNDIGTLTNYEGEIVINGLFIVNLNLKLTGCSNIHFGPNARIQVEQNCRLEIDECTLEAGCDRMWEGIVIENNIYVNSNNNPDKGLVITSSNLSDALIAVSGIDDSRIEVASSNFTYNYEHIKLSNYDIGFNGSINNNTFNCTGYNANMLAPHENERTYKALNFKNVFAVGVFPIKVQIIDNDITEADYGIYAENTGLVVDGKFAQSTKAIIENVSTGIYAIDLPTDSYVSNYEITNCNNGIVLHTLNGFSAIIEKNGPITTASLNPDNNNGAGISVFDNTPTLLTIGGSEEGQGNLINSNARYGINLSGAGDAKVAGNSIFINQGATGGELVFGIYANNSFGVQINSNFIEGDQEGTVVRTNKRGITLDNCGDNKSGVACNSINAVEVGLQFLNDNSPMTTGDNTFNTMDRGFTVGELGVTSGILNKQDYDLTSANQRTSGNNFLGSDGNGHFGNDLGDDIWSGFALYAYEYSSANDPIIYEAFVDALHSYCDIHPFTNSTLFAAENIGFNESNGFQISNAATDGYDDCISCEDINGLVEFTNDEVLETDLNAVRGELEFLTSQQSCYEWVTKLNLYKRLSEDEAYRIINDTLEHFYDTTFADNLSKFYKVDSLMDLLSDTSWTIDQRNLIIEEAIDLNGNIDAEGIYQFNQQSINDIYLNTVAKKTFSLDTTQSETVADISNQCPYEGGFAVFTARTLYHMMIQNEYFDDRVLCILESKEIKDDYESSILFRIFPNPAINHTFIEYYAPGKYCSSIQVSNVLGVDVWNKNLNVENETIDLDTHAFPAGIYFVKLFRGNEIVKVSNLVIVKK